MEISGTPLLWGVFSLIVIFSICVDVLQFRSRSGEMVFREAAIWSVVWVSLALLFGVGIFLQSGTEPAFMFVTGYLIELSLSIDNLFVFLVIFAHFRVPRVYQKKVLTYGIIGAVLMRAVFIVLGAELLRHYDWLLVVFAAILIYSGIKLIKKEEEEFNPERSIVLKIFRWLVPTTREYQDDKLLVRENGKLFATPLLLVIVVVESTDVLFALDSIPAIFGITTNTFLIFTSNIFAVLGLRAFFFLLAGALDKLRLLHYGLAFVLSFVGVKMLLHQFHILEIGVITSLLVVIGALGLTTLLSLRPTTTE